MERRRPLFVDAHRLRTGNGLPTNFGAHPREWPKAVVCQHVDALEGDVSVHRIVLAQEHRRGRSYPVVRLEVVDLFPEHQHP